jgi:hypothetical protein
VTAGRCEAEKKTSTTFRIVPLPYARAATRFGSV